ncbi:Chlorophyll(ide) b reductase [Chlorella vulgaris]
MQRTAALAMPSHPPSSAANFSSSRRGAPPSCRRRQRCATPQAVARGMDIVPPYNVVITGGSKGVGRALAAGFVRAGDNVVLCGRSSDAVAATVEELQGLAGGSSKVHGTTCNVARPEDVAALADFAKEQLGTIDLWINNAGTNAYRVGPLAEQDSQDIIDIIGTNVIGVMLGCKEAIRVMRGQPSGGHIFNMDGAGADGNATPRFAAYGATKRGLAQLGKSLQSELRSEGLKQIGVHNLSPGMVNTELLMAGTNTAVAKFFVNCLAEQPETVADHLVPRIRQVPETSKALLGDGVGSSQYIRYLTQTKAYSQIFARLLTGQRKNRFVAEE